MIPNLATNTVFISDLLPAGHRTVARALKAALGERLRTIPGAKDVWVRDFMPLQLDADRFLQFRYDPDYLRDSPELRTDNGVSLVRVHHCGYSNLVIDGGNIVRWKDAAILTDKVYKENPGHERPALRNALRSALEVDRLIICPQEPGDVVGHADGMVRFVDGHTLLANDYSSANPPFGRRLVSALKRHGFDVVAFPYRPSYKTIDGIPSASGVYINFLQTRDTIMVPAFGLAEDAPAADVLRREFPHTRVVPVRCGRLAENGGVLNCVTWNILINGKSGWAGSQKVEETTSPLTRRGRV